MKIEILMPKRPTCKRKDLNPGDLFCPPKDVDFVYMALNNGSSVNMADGRVVSYHLNNEVIRFRDAKLILTA